MTQHSRFMPENPVRIVFDEVRHWMDVQTDENRIDAVNAAIVVYDLHRDVMRRLMRRGSQPRISLVDWCCVGPFTFWFELVYDAMVLISIAIDEPPEADPDGYGPAGIFVVRQKGRDRYFTARRKRIGVKALLAGTGAVSADVLQLYNAGSTACVPGLGLHRSNIGTAILRAHVLGNRTAPGTPLGRTADASENSRAADLPTAGKTLSDRRFYLRVWGPLAEISFLLAVRRAARKIVSIGTVSLLRRFVTSRTEVTAREQQSLAELRVLLDQTVADFARIGPLEVGARLPWGGRRVRKCDWDSRISVLATASAVARTGSAATPTHVAGQAGVVALLRGYLAGVAATARRGRICEAGLEAPPSIGIGIAIRTVPACARPSSGCIVWVHPAAPCPGSREEPALCR